MTGRTAVFVAVAAVGSGLTGGCVRSDTNADAASAPSVSTSVPSRSVTTDSPVTEADALGGVDRPATSDSLPSGPGDERSTVPPRDADPPIAVRPTPGEGSVSSSSHHHTTVSSDAGTVEARWDDGELEVEITTVAGWTPVVERPTTDSYRVTWTLGTRRVEVDVSASEQGISTTTTNESASSN